MEYLIIIWWISLIVLSGYHLLVYRKITESEMMGSEDDLPGVSLVIAVKNASESVLRNLSSLCEQDYPNFELIIVDDHSTTVEKQILVQGVSGNNLVRLIQADEKPGKKHALSLGIKQAQHDLILCTDADCYPASSGWIRDMVRKSEGKAMVLGYSPYEKKPGFLNLFIRFETMMTGIQYLSWASIGKPYMGVGRNLLYPRSLFLREDPFSNDQVPYGDDDLWVQNAASKTKVKTYYRNAAHVYSTPETSWRNWFRQKHRHLSAGHHYDKKAWLRPAGFAMALITHWFLLLLFFMTGINFWMMGFFVLGLFLRWLTHWRWTRDLGDEDTNYWFPIFELIYAIYLAGMGLFSMVFKKKTWN